MKKSILLILILFLFQSCYFGAGMVEMSLPGNYYLFGNNSVEENAIWYNREKHSSSMIVEQTVFAVGYNKDFIIAKSYSEKNILYHIIEIKKNETQHYINLTFDQYKFNRQHLNLPNDLNFTIVFHEIAKN